MNHLASCGFGIALGRAVPYRVLHFMQCLGCKIAVYAHKLHGRILCRDGIDAFVIAAALRLVFRFSTGTCQECKNGVLAHTWICRFPNTFRAQREYWRSNRAELEPKGTQFIHSPQGMLKKAHNIPTTQRLCCCVDQRAREYPQHRGTVLQC